LERGFAHPDQFKASLTVRQYQELTAYLEHTGYHARAKWRDRMLTEIAYYLAVGALKSPQRQHYEPPGPDRTPKRQTRKQQEALLHAWLAMRPKKSTAKNEA
jgi:hypothetical protein